MRKLSEKTSSLCQYIEEWMQILCLLNSQTKTQRKMVFVHEIEFLIDFRIAE